MRVGILIRLNEDVYGCISHAVQMGFQSGQISVWDMKLYTEEIAKRLKKACEELHFEITAVWCGWSGPCQWSYPDMYGTIGLVPAAWRAQRVKDLLTGAEFAHQIGVKDIITHLGFLPDNPFDADRISVVQSVRYICKEISKYGQRFLFETGEELPCTLIRFMHDVGEENVGVNYDPANLLINARANPVDGLKLLVPYVYGFHGKDAVYPQGTAPKGQEKKIGEGSVDFSALIEVLLQYGYNKDITIERETTDGKERDKEIQEEKEYLEQLISKK